ncbi:MAG TPA: hypothetical protein VM299_02935 [Solirubrobacteraceae bacterium]|jgi:hypothetical protein|nr:hypothetical protein [Solirubrobacteraceae bacterium]
MDFGMHLRELSRLRIGVAICLLLATFAAISVSYRISLSPPALKPRSLAMAAASTDVLVDTPRSLVLDLRQDTFDIESLTNRAVLLGNIMASPPVVSFIAARAGVSPDAIRATTPRTPNSPRPFVNAANKKSARDLLASTDQYRLSIEASPTVPVLNIYAQAPTASAAEALANASVDGLRDYLARIARAQDVVGRRQVRVVQLGRAEGKVINDGIRWQLALLVFVVVLAGSSAAAIFMARVRAGFMLADELEARRRAATAVDLAEQPPPTERDERPSLAIR